MTYDEIHGRLQGALHTYGLLHQGEQPPDLVLHIHPDDYLETLRTWPVGVEPPALMGVPKIGPAEVFLDPHQTQGALNLRSRWEVAL